MSDETPRPGAQNQMNRKNVGAGQEFVFTDQGRAALSRALGGQILTPGNDVHLKGVADSGHL